ncbi:MAG: MarR family transcriptional regulator [Alphaproteobacteria bacterium]|nr:MAG: MarR family transcriptional regulator [Alphaproteobacteria bacterium]
MKIGKRIDRPMPNRNENQNPLVFQISDLFRLMRQAFAKEDGPEITRAQAKVLLTVWRLPGISQQALAARLEVSTMSVCRQVDALEAKQMIERRSDDKDRRVRRLFVTEKTTPLIDTIMAKLADLSDEFLAPLSSEERRTLDSLLNRIIAHASQKRTGVDQ